MLGVCVSVNEKTLEPELCVVTEPFQYCLSQIVGEISEEFTENHKMWATLDLTLGLDALHNTGLPILVLNPDLIFFTGNNSAKLMFPAILQARNDPEKFAQTLTSKPKIHPNDLFLHPGLANGQLSFPSKRINMLIEGYQQDYRNLVAADVFSFISCLSFMYKHDSFSVFNSPDLLKLSGRELGEYFSSQENWAKYLHRVTEPLPSIIGHKATAKIRTNLETADAARNFTLRKFIDCLSKNDRNKLKAFDQSIFKQLIRDSAVFLKDQPDPKEHTHYYPANTKLLRDTTVETQSSYKFYFGQAPQPYKHVAA